MFATKRADSQNPRNRRQTACRGIAGQTRNSQTQKARIAVEDGRKTVIILESKHMMCRTSLNYCELL